MPAVLLRTVGTAYGAYPDAHAILSLLYSQGLRDEDLRVSSLLPVVDGEIYVPAPTSFVGQFGKDINKKIRSGRLYIPIGALSLGDLSDRVEIHNDRVPRVAIDRVTSASNLYFEQTWVAQHIYNDGGRERKEPVSDFAVLYDGSVRGIEKYFVGGTLGANKSHGLTVIGARPIDVDMPINRRSGLLLSLALPSDVPPSAYPVFYEKWVFYRSGGVVYRRSFGVYGAGSYLKAGEYSGGDLVVGSDDRGFDVRLFVRPLFLDVGDA